MLKTPESPKIYWDCFKWFGGVVVQLLSHGWLFATPWTATCQASRSFTISQSLLKFMSIESTNAIQLSYPWSPLSPPAFSISRHQGLYQSVSSSYQVAKVLELKLQHQSFQWTLRTDFLYNWLVWSPCCPRDSQDSSPTLQFKNINSLVLSFLYSPTLTSIHDHSLD